MYLVCIFLNFVPLWDCVHKTTQQLPGLPLTLVGSCGMLPLFWGLGPGTHHTQETGSGPELNIKHTGNTHRKLCLNSWCEPRSLLHPALLSSRSQRKAGRQSPAAHSADNLSNFSAVCAVSCNPITPHPPHPPQLTQICHGPSNQICFLESRG